MQKSSPSKINFPSSQISGIVFCQIQYILQNKNLLQHLFLLVTL